MKKQSKSSPLKMAPNHYFGGELGIGIAGSAGTLSGDNPTSVGSAGWTNPIRGGSGGGEDSIDVEFINTCRPVYVLEKHLSVIRKGPTAPPKIEMYSWEDDSDIDTSITDPDGYITVKTTFQGDAMPQSSNNSPPAPPNTAGTANDLTDISIFYHPNKDILKPQDTIVLPIDLMSPVPGGKPLDWDTGYTLLITHNFQNQFNVQQQATCRVVINDPLTSPPTCTVLAITDNFPILNTGVTDVYEVKAEQIPPLFEIKFPKFAYRYKYEDGEYSVFSPWSETAFMPGKFDYLPKKGHNLGMENTMRSLKVKNWRPKSMPEDVVEIDLLYKESNSPNIYTVETFKKKDPATVPNPCPCPTCPSRVNYWNACGEGDNFGNYTITSELIHKVVPANQLLRPWDNVPRKALGQDITANRIIYANYLQNYDVLDKDGNEIKPRFGTWVESEDLSITGNEPSYQPDPGQPMKSLKSMRTYQLGVVYRDRYGRETPVLTSQSGSLEIPIENAKTSNRLNAVITSPAPDWAESYTFYIKETANEYYNLAMDRWYDAEDDGVWLSFPSSERNKVSDRTTLILKKQHHTDKYVESESKYKVISIKNEAPTFIKTEHKFWGSIPMMLPPPGWGEGGKPGGWDTGMFHITGLPLPNRLYIDVYAEYWDQSVLSGLEKQDEGAQVRITQSQDQTSAYNATPSQTSNKSKWYDVAKVSYIGAEAQTHTIQTIDPAGNTVEQEEEIPGQAEQIVRLTLEEIMGSDMAFCNPTDNLSLSRGLALEARTKIVRDRSQFEGRFFVKVLRDADVQTNIVQTGQVSSDFWQVLMSRDIRYINAAHPGSQTVRTGIAGTTGAGGGSWYGFASGAGGGSATVRNFLPVNKIWGDGFTTNPPNRKYQASSFSEAVGDIAYVGRLGGMVSTSTDLNHAPSNWPYGPSFLANRVFSTGFWFNQYDEYVNINRANKWVTHTDTIPAGTAGYSTNWTTAYPTPQLAVVPDTAARPHGWPSFLIPEWEPRTCHPDSGAINNPCGSIDTASVETHFVTNDFAGGIDLTDIKFTVGDATKGMKDLRGSNAYIVPAIWGDQSDLLGYSGDPDTAAPGGGQDLSLTSSDPVPANVLGAITGVGFRSVWNEDTIKKLRKDWYYLWHGRDKIDNLNWPLGRFSPNRWFFDKVGAAKGFSGNGIWTDNSTGTAVSRISLSFYGIGSLISRQRDFNMLIHQQNEFDFGRLMATPGTQFRFKQDPHSIVYTITHATEPETIFNYEASYGSWGIWDSDSKACWGGGNMGAQKCPPWGGHSVSENGIAGKKAFISDLFNSHRELTGGAPYNFRVRVTLTLDKEIGVGSNVIPLGTAAMGFHPLLNHVDVNGDCNILDGPKTYWDGQAGATPPGWIGGSALLGSQDVLPTPAPFYNLSSYWNYTGGGAPSGQGSTLGFGDSNGQHFGLHERGLNSTGIEIVTPYKGDETKKEMSNNPAVWETEPMEDVGLDIYYAASPTYPIDTRRFRSDEFRPDETDVDANDVVTNAHYFDYNWRGEEIIPVGATVMASPGPNAPTGVQGCPNPLPAPGGACGYGMWANVVGVQGDMIWLDNHLSEDNFGFPRELDEGDELKFFWKGEGEWYGAHNDNMLFFSTIKKSHDINIFKIDSNTHKYWRTLPYYNCYTFSNGVESNRARDDYNAVTIDKGVKASMPLAETYEEERRGSSLIFSGIYNSTSGINRTNQFIQAEPITKDLNPINGSIQKIFARDTDLVTFCENKVFKILAKKDALFNADGNTNVTSNTAVLGQTMPFTGEYGISRNPESFAQESYRLYFSDKDRGAILRLSRDGLTPISDKGMKDWFKDNLKRATSIIGSFDDRKDEYNITVETADTLDFNYEKAYTLSFTEASKGWVSFKSFVHQGGISHKNIYYTFPSNKYSHVEYSDPWEIPYSTGVGSAETYQHALDLETKRIIFGGPYYNTNIITYSGDSNTTILIGMNVEGNGLPYGTTVESIILPLNGTTSCQLSNTVYIDNSEEIIFTAPRNRFYSQPHYSMVKTIFNKDQGNVKRFKTLNYEGSQAKIVPIGGVTDPINQHQIDDGTGVLISVGQKYLDNYPKEGWYAHKIKTDLQEGSVKEFVDKENKWFDYIRGEGDNLDGDNLDASDFSLQGIGMYNGGDASIPTNQQ